MSYFYSIPEREGEEHALPDCEVYYMAGEAGTLWPYAGWYWWPCFPGCLPDGDPIGPFDSEQEAIDDARDHEGIVR